ncbi:unnamed protein product [Cercospora beticola]|nr:unnamed protein product [Cercospora beticola]
MPRNRPFTARCPSCRQVYHSSHLSQSKAAPSRYLLPILLPPELPTGASTAASKARRQAATNGVQPPHRIYCSTSTQRTVSTDDIAGSRIHLQRPNEHLTICPPISRPCAG